jgi:FtsP/CotA-like multicopper oxidase with cupredoxin domain
MVGLLLRPSWSGAQHGHLQHALADSEVKADPIAASGAPLVEPEVRRSVNGELRTTLRARYTYKDLGGFRLYLRSYEGAIPGPTLRMRPGDTLRMRLVNDMPPDRDVVPVNTGIPHRYNTTNFHFHGAHASPSGIADNVMRTMLPGKSYDVEIALPRDHTSGTYWYHPHHHGSADVQVGSGMAGMIVVEGDFEAVPEIASAKERTLVLNTVQFDHMGTIESFDTLWPETNTRFFSINGQREPVLRMRPGEVQRWRLLQAGYQSNTLLELAGHALHAIAWDGIALPGVHEMRTLLMAPGQRADVLVRAGQPGTYDLRALPFDQGYPSPTGLMARLIVEGEPMPMTLPRELPAPPLRTIRDNEITGRRTLTLSARVPETEAAADWREFAFLIDGRTFDPGRVDQRVRLGAVEEWTIVNDHFHDHVFHIHTNPFQVTSINDKPEPDLPWRDTVVVPRKGRLTFRSRFLDYTGVFMLHCHMMNHEDLGMMQVVEVY